MIGARQQPACGTPANSRHVPVGKVSFSPEQLLENFTAVLDEILRAKPASAKGRYIKSVSVSSTMGPGVRIDPAATDDDSPSANSSE